MKSFFIKVLIFLGLIIIGLVGYSLYKEIGKKKIVQDEIQKLQEEAEKVSRENTNLEEKIAYLESKDYREREAKDKLNLQSPGESVVVIKPSLSKEGEKPENKITDSQPQSKEVSNPRKWWNYFFSYSTR